MLAADVKPGRKVENLHCGVRGVNVLPARAARAADLDPEVFLFHLDIDLLRLRHNGNGYGGSVDSALRFGRRHPLHPMNPGLVFQMAEHLVPRNFQDDLLEAADLRR